MAFVNRVTTVVARRDRWRSTLGRLTLLPLLVGAVLLGPAAPDALADQDYTLSNVTPPSLAAQVGTAFSHSPQMAVFVVGTSTHAPGVEVTFTAPASGASGTFSNGSHTIAVTSGTNGIADAGTFTANDTPGSFQVTALVTGDAQAGEDEVPNSTGFINTVGDPSKATSISQAGGSNQVALLDTAFSDRLQVAVFDGSTNHKNGVPVVFEAPASGASGTFAGGATSTTVTTGSVDVGGITHQGFAQAPVFTANDIEGAYQVTATVSGEHTSTGDPLVASFALGNSTTNTVGVPAIVSTAYGNQQVKGGELFSPLEAFVFDGSLDQVTGASVTFTFVPGATGSSAEWDPLAGGGTVWTGTTDSDGMVRTPDFRANLAGGDFTVQIDAAKDGVSKSTSVQMSIGRYGTATSLAVPAHSLHGDPVTLTATVANTDAPATTTSGEVTFQQDGTTIGACTDVPLAGGQAVCTLGGGPDSSAWLAPGPHDFSVDFSGNPTFEPSTSTTQAHVVLLSPEISVSPADATVVFGDEATFVAEGIGYPRPSVTWQVSTDGGASWAPAPGAVSESTSGADFIVSELTLTPAKSDDGNHYRAVFSNAVDEATSTAGVLDVQFAPGFTSADTATFTVGEAGSHAVATDANPAATLSVTSGALPTGVVFDAATGVLSGMPADGQGGVFPLEFTATNGLTPDGLQDFTLTVHEAPALTGPDAAEFEVGSAGSFAVTADGFPAPTLALTSGSLPDGISFDQATGTFSGTPAEDSDGVHVLEVTATNGVGDDATQTVTLTVHRATVHLTLIPSTTTVDQGDTVTFTVTGSDASGDPTGDVTDEVTLTSDVATDIVEGNTVTFPTASPHTITARHVDGATGTVVVEVTPTPESTEDAGGSTGGSDGSTGGSAGTAGPTAAALPATGGPSLPLAAVGLLALVAGLALLLRARQVDGTS